MVGPGLTSERRGTTALEFAILSVPFTLFLMFLFELGLDLYIQLALDYAVYQGARQLQTGAGNAAPSANVFKTDCLCPAVAGFLNCGQISLNVYPLSSTDYYQNAQTSSGSVPVVAGVLNLGNFTFVPSGSTTPMFLQATYTSVSTVGMLLPSMSVKSGTGRVHLTISAIGFVNEPFTSSGMIMRGHVVIRVVGRILAPTLRNCRSATASMEFGIVCPVMVVFLMGIVDVCQAIIKSRLLEHAVQQTGLMATQIAVQPIQTNVLTVAQLNVASSVIFAILPGLGGLAVYDPVKNPSPPFAVTVSEIVYSGISPSGCSGGLTCSAYTANVIWTVPLKYGQQLQRQCGVVKEVGATADPLILNGVPSTVPTAGITSAKTAVLAVDIMYQYTPIFGRFIGPITMRQSGYFNPRPYTTYATSYAGINCASSS